MMQSETITKKKKKNPVFTIFLFKSFCISKLEPVYLKLAWHKTKIKQKPCCSDFLKPYLLYYCMLHFIKSTTHALLLQLFNTIAGKKVPGII